MQDPASLIESFESPLIQVLFDDWEWGPHFGFQRTVAGLTDPEFLIMWSMQIEVIQRTEDGHDLLGSCAGKAFENVLLFVVLGTFYANSRSLFGYSFVDRLPISKPIDPQFDPS